MRLQKNLYYAILVGLFAVPFIPFIVSGSMLFPFITGKGFAFRILVEIIFACFLILSILDKQYRPKFSWINITVLFFLIFVGLADFFSENPHKSFWSNFERMEGYIALLHFGAFYLVLTNVFKAKDLWNRFFAINVFASAIMAVYSFLQLMGKITINQGGVRVDGTFGNATYLGIYMVFNLFFIAYLYLQSPSKLQKYLLFIVGLADLAVLYYTATRGAILGLLGGAVLSFFILGLKSEKGSRIRKYSLAFIISIIVLAGAFFLVKDNPKVQNNPVLGRFASISFSEIKTQGRYFVWPIAWKGFLERPILGWGQESFNFVFNKYYDPRMYTQEPWFDRTHDIILDWLVAGGALGFLSYAAIFYAFLYTLLKRSNLSKEEKSLLVGLSAAYIFHNLFVFDQIGSYILFFSVLSFVNANSENNSPNWARSISSRVGSFIDKQSMVPVSSSIIIILLALTIYYWNLVPMKESRDIIKMLQSASIAESQKSYGSIDVYKTPFSKYILGFPEALEHESQVAVNIAYSQNATTEFKEDIFNLVNDAFKTQITKVPDDARYRLFYAMFLSRLNLLDPSIEQYEAAIKLSPGKQSIYFELGDVLISAGKKEEGLAVLKKAYEILPSYDEAKFIYGLGALASGENDLAREILSSYPQDKLIFDDRYISILASLKRYSEVIAIAKERVKRDPYNIQFHITLAAAYLDSGQREMAISAIQDLININPTFKQQGEYYISEIRAGRNP